MAFNAVTGDLLKAADRADTAGGELTTMLTTLLSDLAPLESRFRGGAGMSFQQVQARIQQDLVQITDALNEVASGVRSSGKDFEVADQVAQDEVNRAAAAAGDAATALRG